jgi:hypothetical protein
MQTTVTKCLKRRINKMANSRIQLNETSKSETIQEAQVTFTPRPDTYQGKKAFEIKVARPYLEVAGILSHVTDFFPFISGSILTYPVDFPREKLQINMPNALLNKTFEVLKPGMEDASSRYTYLTVEYTDERFTLVTALCPDNKSSFQSFYNVVSCCAVVDGTTLVHAESGFTLTGFSSLLGKSTALSIVSSTLELSLDRINLWMTHPDRALQQKITRKNLVEANPPASDGPIAYTSITNFNCSTKRLIEFMSKDKSKCFAFDVLCCEAQSGENKFSKKVPVADEVSIERVDSKANVMAFAPPYSLLGNSNNLYVEIEAKEGLTEFSSDVTVKTSGSFRYASISKMRTFFKEWMADYNGKITQRLASAIQQQDNIADITPDLATQKAQEIIPENIRPRLMMRK